MGLQCLQALLHLLLQCWAGPELLSLSVVGGCRLLLPKLLMDDATPVAIRRFGRPQSDSFGCVSQGFRQVALSLVDNPSVPVGFRKIRLELDRLVKDLP